MAEPTDPADDQARRAEKDERHRLAIQDYNDEMRRRKAEDNAKFNGLQIGDIDTKLKSQLYLALGREGQKLFSHKILEKEYWILTFAEFWELLKTTFTVTTNLTYERYKFFGRRQKENESLEKFHETLSELAKNCKLGELESELVRDIFYYKYAKCRDTEKTMYRILDSRKRAVLRTCSREWYQNSPAIPKIPCL